MQKLWICISISASAQLAKRAAAKMVAKWMWRCRGFTDRLSSCPAVQLSTFLVLRNGMSSRAREPVAEPNWHSVFENWSPEHPCADRKCTNTGVIYASAWVCVCVGLVHVRFEAWITVLHLTIVWNFQMISIHMPLKGRL